MSAFRTHGRGHLNGPVVVVGTGLLGTSIGLGLRGRGVPVFLSDPSPTNQAVAVDIGAGLPLARLDGDQPVARINSVLFQFRPHQRQRQRRPVDGSIDQRPDVRHTADVIFVSMRQDQRRWAR